MKQGIREGGDIEVQVSQLEQIKMSRLSTILIKLMKMKSEKVSPNEVLDSYSSKQEFFSASGIDQRDITKLQSVFLNQLPREYAALELSPIAPFSTNTSITKLSQNLILTSTKNSEVCADPTTMLALEASKLRRQMLLSPGAKNETVKLATAARALRMQPFEKGKGYTQHFGVYGICTAGRDTENRSFSESAILEHINLWLDFIREIEKKYPNSKFKEVTVKISDVNVIEHLISFFKISRKSVNENSLASGWNLFERNNVDFPAEVASLAEIIDNENYKEMQASLNKLARIENRCMGPLYSKFPNVKFVFSFNRKAGLGYYAGPCFHIFATTVGGEIVQMVDGGSVDWTSKFLSSEKERCFTSGFGSELIIKHFNLCS
jgi:hypothetical protein